MRAVSLFSGVGGFDLGMERAGIETVLQVEIDPWCRDVLALHWPNVERMTDVRGVGVHKAAQRRGGGKLASGRDQSDRGWLESEARSSTGVDLIYGGFPCQDLSVAGKRAGFGGERSSLWFEFHRVLSELRPRWAVIENVPGLLSSNGGRDFAVLLSGLVELRFGGIGWAVLDAQHFGVPQRRRRVFVVAGPTERACQQILAVCESCSGHSPTRRQTGQGLAYSLTAGVRGTGDGHGNAWNTTYVTGKTLTSGGHGNNPLDENLVAVAGGLTARYGKGTDSDADDALIIAGSLRASDGHHGHSSPRGDGTDNLVASTLRSHPRPGSNDTGAVTGVRRLTPLECERLQGWPDDWTRYTADGREVSDSIRYRMIGNGVASPCAEWIGHRLVWADQEMG